MTEPSVKIFEDQRFTAVLRGISTVCSTIAAAGVLGIAANMVSLNKAADKLTLLYEVVRRDLDSTMQDTEVNKTELREIWREIDKTKVISIEMQKRLGMR